MADLLYLNLSESVLAESRKVTIKDVSKLVCDNPDVKYGAEKIELMNFSGTKQQQVISILDIIEEIHKKYPGTQIINLGQPEVIVYYKSYDTADRMKQTLKLIFICLIAFLGAGFSIISYNSDVNLAGQLDLMQNLFAGESESGFMVAGLAYSIGLFIGIIVFFNHGTNKKFSDDPTPLQVQMRTYEQEVNKTIITDAQRKKDIRDAD
ncbi:MAG: stage V sporulation protein AA [Coprococcus sp.]